ncbi:50S ribosomal protein L24 [Patescibacteria group bacterium]
MKIKKGDKVIVMSGKDKGKTGKVQKVFPKINRVQIEGVNMYKRHRKARSEKDPGGIIDVTRSIDVSKIAFVDPKTSKPTRIGYHVSKGEKVRISKKSEQVI